MNVFNSDGKLNKAVFAPAADKKTLFNEDRDTWLAWLIYVGIGAVVILVVCILGFIYDVAAFLAVPVGIGAVVVLACVVAIWVWFDSDKV